MFGDRIDSMQRGLDARMALDLEGRPVQNATSRPYLGSN